MSEKIFLDRVIPNTYLAKFPICYVSPILAKDVLMNMFTILSEGCNVAIGKEDIEAFQKKVVSYGCMCDVRNMQALMPVIIDFDDPFVVRVYRLTPSTSVDGSNQVVGTAALMHGLSFVVIAEPQLRVELIFNYARASGLGIVDFNKEVDEWIDEENRGEQLW